MKANRLDPDTIPTVIQFNKRDLPDIQTDAELAAYAERGREPITTAIAIRGEGVLETLKKALDLLFDHLVKVHDFEKKVGVTKQDFIERLVENLKHPVRVEEMAP